jgi:hypothetical protein
MAQVELVVGVAQVVLVALRALLIQVVAVAVEHITDQPLLEVGAAVQALS